MTALRYMPGQIVVFRTSPMRTTFDESSLSAFGEQLVSQSYELRSGLYYLDLYVVNSGEELRFLDLVRAQPGVVGASLNYIGFGLAETNIGKVTPPELSYQPGTTVLSDPDLTCFLLTEGAPNILTCTYDDLKPKLEEAKSDYLIAAIDVKPDHCQMVMRMIAEGFNHKRPDRDMPSGSSSGATIVGLTCSVDNSTMTDLLHFGDRLMLLAQLVNQNEMITRSKLVAINMSVDFSQVISGYNALDAASIESPDMIFSLPLMENMLDTAVANLTLYAEQSEYPEDIFWSPAVFAAAGNRVSEGAEVRVRLGYPANRPETIATTFVTLNPTNPEAFTPVDWVDVPATTGLKPCFAIDVKEMEPTMYDGSSFASAWLAGYYAALTYSDDIHAPYLGLFSKVARLMQRTERHILNSGKHRLPSFVAVIRDGKMPSRTLWDMDHLIADLWKKFKADFCLYGSSAAVGEWLRLNNRHLEELEPWVKKDLGDIDMLYAGTIRRQSNDGASQDNDDASQSNDDVKGFVRDWFRERLGRAWVQDRKRPIDLHPYEGVVSARERLRSVTPVNKLYITRGGVIDTWGGLDDLERHDIRFLPVTDTAFWERNSLFSTGADCPALNILQWISIVALLQLVSHALSVQEPRANEDSVAQVQEILARANTREEQIRLFGYRTADLRERIPRRFERIETLMGSCARRNIVDNTLDEILKQLQNLWQNGHPIQ